MIQFKQIYENYSYLKIMPLAFQLLTKFFFFSAEVKDLISCLGGTIQSKEMPVKRGSIIIIPDGTHEEVKECLLRVRKLSTLIHRNLAYMLLAHLH